MTIPKKNRRERERQRLLQELKTAQANGFSSYKHRTPEFIESEMKRRGY